MKPMFLLGCAGQGVQPSSIEAPVSEIELPVMEQFRLQKEAGCGTSSTVSLRVTKSWTNISRRASTTICQC
jgi:hypothetical protein